MSPQPQPKAPAGQAQSATPWASVEAMFNKQKSYFASDATKSYEWRVDQLNRLGRMLRENYRRFADAAGRAEHRAGGRY